jgi:hypothetical protein
MQDQMPLPARAAALPTRADALRDKAVMLWHLQRIKRLVRARCGGQCLVHVTEITCADPDCPGPATQISVTGFDLIRRSILVHRTLAAITEIDLASLSGG